MDKETQCNLGNIYGTIDKLLDSTTNLLDRKMVVNDFKFGKGIAYNSNIHSYNISEEIKKKRIKDLF